MVNAQRVREVSQETYLLILENFPWVSVSNTLHKFLGHLHQFIERNNCFGLCNLSEEGLEQGHKLIREFSIHLSRKSNFIQGVSDVAMRLQSGSLIVNPLGTKNLVHNIETSY